MQPPSVFSETLLRRLICTNTPIWLRSEIKTRTSIPQKNLPLTDRFLRLPRGCRSLPAPKPAPAFQPGLANPLHLGAKPRVLDQRSGADFRGSRASDCTASPGFYFAPGLISQTHTRPSRPIMNARAPTLQSGQTEGISRSVFQQPKKLQSDSPRQASSPANTKPRSQPGLARSSEAPFARLIPRPALVATSSFCKVDSPYLARAPRAGSSGLLLRARGKLQGARGAPRLAPSHARGALGVRSRAPGPWRALAPSARAERLSRPRPSSAQPCPRPQPCTPARSPRSACA